MMPMSLWETSLFPSVQGHKPNSWAELARLQSFTKGIPVNKTQLIDALSTRYEGNRKQAQHALESVLDTITREVARGEKVAITGFGSFEKRVREARWVRNPRTGDRIKAKKTAVPKFTPGADLKAVVSGAKKLPKLPKASELAKTATAPARKAADAAKKSAPAKKVAEVAKKATPSKTTAKKTTKSAAKTTKAPAKKTSTASKSTASKTASKSTAAKSTAKTAAKKTSTASKSSTSKKSTAKAPAKKSSTAKKSSPAKKTTTAKASAPAKKAPAKKAPAKKSSTAKKSTAKKSTAKKS